MPPLHGQELLEGVSYKLNYYHHALLVHLSTIWTNHPISYHLMLLPELFLSSPQPTMSLGKLNFTRCLSIIINGTHLFPSKMILDNGRSTLNPEWRFGFVKTGFSSTLSSALFLSKTNHLGCNRRDYLWGVGNHFGTYAKPTWGRFTHFKGQRINLLEESNCIM